MGEGDCLGPASIHHCEKKKKKKMGLCDHSMRRTAAPKKSRLTRSRALFTPCLNSTPVAELICCGLSSIKKTKIKCRATRGKKWNRSKRFFFSEQA